LPRKASENVRHRQRYTLFMDSSGFIICIYIAIVLLRRHQSGVRTLRISAEIKQLIKLTKTLLRRSE